MKLIDRMDGAISIFLCIVLTSMIVLSGLLIDGSRARAGETQAQAAAENSIRSVLASYDSMLKDLYGLFALSDESADSLNEEIEAYMNRTLMTELGLDKSKMGDKAYNYLKTIITSSGKNNSINFLNLFDYGIDELEGEPLYNLAQNEVLGNQIIEHMKYRVPKELAEGFLDRLEMFKNFGKQSGIMKKKIDVDKEMDKIRSDREMLSDAVAFINDFSTNDGGGNINDIYKEFVDLISERAYLEIELQKQEKIRDDALENMEELEPELEAKLDRVDSLKERISDLADNPNANPAQLDSLRERLSDAKTSYKEVKNEYESFEDEYERAKSKCKSLNDEIIKKNGLADEKKKTVTDLINNCQLKCSEAKLYIDKIIEESQSINSKINEIDSVDLDGDTSDFSNQIRLDLGNSASAVSSTKLKDIKNAVTKNEEVLRDLKEILSSSDEDSIEGANIPDKLGKSLNSITEAEVYSYVRKMLDYIEVLNILKGYYGRCNSNTISYNITRLTRSDSSASDSRKDSQKIVKEYVFNKDKISDVESYEPKEPDDSDMVSKTVVEKKDYSEEDAQYIEAVLKGYTNISSSVNKGDKPEELDYGSEKLREIMNGADFNNINEGFSASGLEFLTRIGEILKNSLENMRDSMYINEYAMGYFKNVLSEKATSKSQPEKDLSGVLKSNRKTHYDGEVEYILTGMKSQQKNLYAIEAQILLIRFSLNTLAIFCDPEKVSEALLAAEAIAGFTVFGVPIVQSMILLGWSMAESIADVKLIMGGDRVPVYKVKGDWILDKTSALKNFAKATAAEAGHIAVDMGKSKAEDLANAAKEKIDKIVEQKVNIAVDNVYAPLEKEMYSRGDVIEDMSGKLLGKVDIEFGDNSNTTASQLQKAITVLVNREFSTVEKEIRKNIKEISTEQASKLITSRKNSTKEAVIKGAQDLTSKLKDEVDDAASEGAGKLEEYIGNSFGKSTFSVGGSMNASLTAMGYQDYLRLLLLLRSNNTKLSRIADLIQLNMRLEKGSDEFMLEDCNTYIRLKGTVTMKYLFMTSIFMPDELRFKNNSRHRINLLLYQGY